MIAQTHTSLAAFLLLLALTRALILLDVVAFDNQPRIVPTSSAACLVLEVLFVDTLTQVFEHLFYILSVFSRH